MLSFRAKVLLLVSLLAILVLLWPLVGICASLLIVMAFGAKRLIPLPRRDGGG